MTPCLHPCAAARGRRGRRRSPGPGRAEAGRAQAEGTRGRRARTQGAGGAPGRDPLRLQWPARRRGAKGRPQRSYFGCLKPGELAYSRAADAMGRAGAARRARQAGLRLGPGVSETFPWLAGSCWLLAGCCSGALVGVQSKGWSQQ